MGIVAVAAEGTSLVELVNRASQSLASATTSAEVLDAREMARVAFDAAKSAARMSRAKKAHDEVIAAVYRAQADALLIEAAAKRRIADEYDAAQARGEVRQRADNQHVVDHNKLSTAEIGLRRDEIHEFRKLRDAEAADPGVTERVVEQILEEGREPTRAQMREAVLAAVEAQMSGKLKPPRSGNRNPIHEKASPEEDAVSAFSHQCWLISHTENLGAIASWRGDDLRVASSRPSCKGKSPPSRSKRQKERFICPVLAVIKGGDAARSFPAPYR